ncbi:MAG: hypothetical protein AAF618_13435 [Pseudomonadota bacterium]
MDGETRLGPARSEIALGAQHMEGQKVPPPQHGPLAGLDVWNLRDEDGWRLFEGNLPGARGPRGYRQRGDGPILADGPKALLGLFELGGQAVAYATRGPSAFPYHVFTADDDIGTVGMAGLELAPETSALGGMRERTAPALVAEALLVWQAQDNLALPLFCARTETESAASLSAFSEGRALENLTRAVANWRAAAEDNGLAAELCAVLIDVASDDLTSEARGFETGMRALCTAIQKQALGDALARPPRLLTLFDSGAQRPVRPALIEAQWRLCLHPGDQSLTFAAPSYMLEIGPQGWLTDRGRLHKAEMMAAALTFAPDDRDKGIYEAPSEGWHCPTPLHAEWQGGHVDVTYRAMAPLVLDDADPFAAGKNYGFTILGADGPCAIESVSVSESDPRKLELRPAAKPRGPTHLLYAAGASASATRTYPSNAGALRDDWAMWSTDGTALHRWAYPCHLPIVGL